MNDKSEKVPTLKEMYPDKTEEELADIEDRVKRYMALVIRVYNRISADPNEYARWRALTKSRRDVL